MIPPHLERYKPLLLYGRKTGDERNEYGFATDYAIALKVLAFTLGDPTMQYYDVQWPDIIAPLIRVYINDKDWLLELTKIIRKVGKVKNGILITSHLFTADEIADVLSDMPVTQLLKFADMARKKREIFGGLSARKKKGIAKILNDWGVERNEFQAIKYRGTMRDLLKLVHPKPANATMEVIWGWVLKKKSPPTEKIEVAEKIISRKIDAETAVQLALEYNLPWELVRSHVSINEIPEYLFEEAVYKLMTPTDRALQASIIARKLGTGFIMSQYSRLFAKTDLYHLAKMTLGLYRQRQITAEEGEELTDFVFSKVPKWLEDRELIIDASGSMEEYWYSYRIPEIGLALKPRGSVILFSNNATKVDVDFRWWAEEWKANYFGGTCIPCGLAMAENEEAIMITDEQQNTGAIELLKKSKVKDLLYAVVGTYSRSFVPEIVASGDIKVTFTVGDTLPTIIAGLQASDLLEQVELYKKIPKPKEVEQLLKAKSI